MDRRDIGSWLDGPGTGSRAASGYPGERLGRPETGFGSIGGFGRRLGGVAVDWALALIIGAAAFGNSSFAPLAVFVVEHLVLVATAGATIGHRAFGLRIETVAGEHPGPWRAIGRALLLGLGVPALIWDRDQRGLHDQAMGTLVARR
jgi:uncharacterized RDD family membrane protein YckC